MRSGFSVWKKASLACLILLVAAVVLYKLYPVFFLPSLVSVTTNVMPDEETPATRFDRALIAHLPELAKRKSFHHVFSGGVWQSEISALWVDSCEVSQGNFQSFVQWEKLSPQEGKIQALGQPLDWGYKSNTYDHAISGKLTAPANGVTFYDAHAYCEAVGGRLPYKNEWIAIASGIEERLYPWGDAFVDASWPYQRQRLNAAQRCGSHPQTDTPEGVHDMGGNVAEWGQNRDAPLKPVILGGNAYDRPYELYGLNRLYRHAPIRYRSPYVGFRCVYDKKPVRATPWHKELTTVAFPAGKYSTGIPEGTRVAGYILRIPAERLDEISRVFGSEGNDGNGVVLFMTHEVSRGQYQDFLLDSFVQLGVYADKNEPDTHAYLPDNWAQQMVHPELPVVGVDWWSARAYAAWRGGRLPTSEEWAIAASNRGETLYPWGNEFQPSSALTGDARLNQPAVPGSWVGDKTREGIYDMGGNISEWTKSAWLGTAVPTVIVRGGNFLLPGSMTAGVDFVNHLPPAYRSPVVGLRVVFDSRNFLDF